MKRALPLLTSLVLLSSCAPYTTLYGPQTTTQRYNTALHEPQTPTQLHEYVITITDIDNNPLDSVIVNFTIKEFDVITKTDDVITSEDGIASISYWARSDPRLQSRSSFSTHCDYQLFRDGFYGKKGLLFAYGNGSGIISDYTKETVSLLRPIDYLSLQFQSDQDHVAIRDKIIQLIDLIKLQGLLAESDMTPRSIALDRFKDKSYLGFGFKSTTTYNSLQLNKYDIGKRIFDETVRKILNPLNEFVSDPDEFFGYDLKIIGYMKDFGDKYATKIPIEYRFMIPQDIVRQYKEKDISGQKVLDESIILMDDERIELKLQ